jgi:exodeoxyribonuclease VII large subunit
MPMALPDMNKLVEMPLVPQRLAIISSATAAVTTIYESVCETTKISLEFLLKLFPAVMQGEQAESSIIRSL